MKKSLILFVMAAFAIAAAAGDHAQYVNPLIGTQTDDTGALSGSTFPGACWPLGLVQLSPDTEKYITWDPCSGYDYDRNRIYGFSHTHLSGTGCTDLFDVMLMPVTVPVTTAYLAEGDFSQTFSHEHETARPGYYGVRLLESGVEAEFTATPHAGIHRYTFPKGAEETIIVDLDHSSYRGEDAYYAGKRSYDIVRAQMRIVDDHTIEGFRLITGWAPLRRVFFRAEFSKPFARTMLIDRKRTVEGTVINGRYLRAALTFDHDTDDAVTVKVALSAVDDEGARRNFAAECRSWDFDSYAAAADREWESHLAKIDIEGTDEQKNIFYTGLYHTLIHPNQISDVDGRYTDATHQVRQLPRGQKYYSTFSLWDTFRAAHPLYNLLEPELTADFVRSMILHQQAYGYMPIWTLWGQENYCMIGNHAVPVLSRAILTGIPGIDVEAAYRAMVASCTQPHTNSPFDVWEHFGYMPADLQGNSVSITMEQAFDDWCVYAVARALGHDDDAARFLRRSQFYRNLFDPATGFFVPRDTKGDKVEPFNPLAYDTPYFIEGNAWQYMWFVPHDPQGLIDLLGGAKGFMAKLDECFTLESDERDSGGNASGFIGQYAHGNEPAHHTTYLYNYAGRPWRTQELVDQVRRSFYNARPCGYAGNDDCGQMSAWYVFSALGFYPFNAGADDFAIGTPLYNRATLHLPGGHDFTIVAPRKDARAIYVRDVRLNGQRTTGLTLTQQQILAGGTLEFKMATKHK